MRLLDALIEHLKEQNQCLSSHRFYCETSDVCDHHHQVSTIDLKHEKHFQEQKTIRTHNSRAGNPSNLSPVSRERCFQILLNCEKQQLVSCTSNSVEQRYDFRKRTMFLQKWILNLQDLPQSQSLETVPVCIVWQYFPHLQYCLFSYA